MSLNSLNIKTALSQFLPQRYLTARLLKFLYGEGVFDLLTSMNQFVLDEAIMAFQKRLGYKLQDRTKIRMAKVLIDLLHECGYLQKDNGLFTWNISRNDLAGLQEEENENIKNLFKGQVNFFEECIVYAHEFLSGAPPLYGFNNRSIYTWEEFLGNDEFRFARSVLSKLLLFEKREDCNILDLCCGPGFDILQIQELSPDIRVTALDFTDIFYEQASNRILNLDSVKWVDSKLWKGFGTPLPFNDQTFDIVFFACADPYISEELREDVYRDIFRILRHGGSLGILTNTYPDPDREYVRDTWIRRGVLSHDFSESVCEGWHGFYNAEESVNLFKKVGYNIATVMFNASIWRLVKP